MKLTYLTAEKHKVQTKTIAFDFNNSNYADYEKAFLPVLSTLDVGILGRSYVHCRLLIFAVNNVGISYDHPEYFLEVPQQRVTQLINLNVNAVTLLTSIVS